MSSYYRDFSSRAKQPTSLVHESELFHFFFFSEEKTFGDLKEALAPSQSFLFWTSSSHLTLLRMKDRQVGGRYGGSAAKGRVIGSGVIDKSREPKILGMDSVCELENSSLLWLVHDFSSCILV